MESGCDEPTSLILNQKALVLGGQEHIYGKITWDSKIKLLITEV